MVYGYARVSTKGQAKDGNSLEDQIQKLKEAGAVEIYTDSFTGIKMNRPEFDKLLNLLCSGDCLIVTKLDRIARSLSQGSELISSLIEKDITINILNIGVMDNKPASKLIRNIFLSFAEFERDMIVERTQEGKAIAKTKAGFREGRPKKFTASQLDYAMILLESHSYPQVEAMTKISMATLAREKPKRLLA